MGMSPFRRSVNSENSKKAFGGKQFKKGGKFWFEKWKLPQTNPVPFVIVSGDYVDPNPPSEQIEIDPATGKAKEVKNAYFKSPRHKRKFFKNGKESYADIVCSAGIDPHNPQPCVGCMAMDNGDKTVTKSEQYMFTIVHLHPYHTHPMVDRETGKLVQKKAENGGGYVMIDTECSGRICNFCAILKGKPVADPAFPKYTAGDIGTILGKRRYMEVGKSHLSNLAGWDATIRAQCGNCKGQLDLVGYACDSCGIMNIDASNDTRTDEQLEEAVSRPSPCNGCKRATLHREVVGCQICESNGKTASQQSLFGVVLWGSRQGEGTKSQLMLARFETPEEHTSKVPAPLLNGRTVQQIITEIGKPYNFSESMAPEDLQSQAHRLDISIPSNIISNHEAPTSPFMQPSTQFAPYPPIAQGPQITFMPPVLPLPPGK